MLEKLEYYKEQLENLMSDLECKDPVTEAAQERLEEQMDALQECIEKFEDLLDALNDYQDTYRGLAKIK